MLIIRKGRVLDPKTSADQIMDLIIDHGTIIDAGPDAADAYSRQDAQVIDAEGLVVAPGLIDVHVHFRDPGFTYKEDIHTGAAAAAAGGFTTVVCMANTKPPVDNPETLEYVIQEGKKTPIHVLTAANITVGMKGETLTDMELLKAHGAVGFTDDGIPLKNAALVKKAMEEAARLNVPLSFHEEDPSLISDNGINQGAVSRELGIGGSPAAAEDVLVARDCMLALHTGAVIDIQHISSGNSVRMVELAKQLGAHVMAEVTPHHFTLNETAVLKHGALAKMNPPLRTEADRQEILRGLKEGIIEIIATDHAPHSAEEKSRPLTQAPSGITGLETALSLGITGLVRTGCLSMLQLMEKMSYNPARLYHLESTKGWIGKGSDADLVIFDPEQTWTVEHFQSKSSNSPFIGKTLHGVIRYTICDGNVVWISSLKDCRNSE
ncbi:MAG: dihydroorotase [Eubacteriales bacterium]|nr:dihydroorotase [Eubacteriales bacterium]